MPASDIADHHGLRPPGPDEACVSWPPLGEQPNVLIVWPRFPPSFWGFEGMMRLLPEKSSCRRSASSRWPRSARPAGGSGSSTARSSR